MGVRGQRAVWVTEQVSAIRARHAEQCSSDLIALYGSASGFAPAASCLRVSSRARGMSDSTAGLAVGAGRCALVHRRVPCKRAPFGVSVRWGVWRGFPQAGQSHIPWRARSNSHTAVACSGSIASAAS